MGGGVAVAVTVCVDEADHAGVVITAAVVPVDAVAGLQLRLMSIAAVAAVIAGNGGVLGVLADLEDRLRVAEPSRSPSAYQP